MQGNCLRLMGKKLLVALAMEGKFAGEGLQSLDDDDDLLTAMARELVEQNGIGESADLVWRHLTTKHQRLFATRGQENRVEAGVTIPGTGIDCEMPSRPLIEEVLTPQPIFVFGEEVGKRRSGRQRGRTSIPEQGSLFA